MDKQKVLDYLKSLPVDQQKLCSGIYKNSDNVCCILGILSPTLREHAPVIGIGMLLTHYGFEKFSLEAQKELAEFDLNILEAEQLQIFNDRDRHKSHDQRFKDTVNFIEDNF